MKIALSIAYNGSRYIGWQKQAHDENSLGQCVEEACSFVAGHRVKVFCAGRTDARVHATQQFVHFETESLRREGQWLSGINSHLPNAIKVTKVLTVDDQFHARFSALSRHYCYVIDTSRVSNPLADNLVTWYPRALNIEYMQQAAKWLEGKHDFTSFRSSQCQANTAMRCVEFITLYQQAPYIVMEIKANAFLHHMVRNIVGVLLEIGQGAKPTLWMKELLSLKDRSKAAVTAPAQGLYLVGVDYNSFISKPEYPFFIQKRVVKAPDTFI
jgi:tRNA pseudouridine38-40 synthase